MNLTFILYPKALEKEQRLKSDAEGKGQRLTIDLANLKSTQNQNDYKRENYNRIKRSVLEG